ncbi:hypothetical protein AADZ90_003500 [Aestuariibius sp. 2305UL40-4]|uniref:hypothetical protein n=1 Tax=Aestuariibius violaceus TaxID=3234132 RepID=UPI00345E7792
MRTTIAFLVGFLLFLPEHLPADGIEIENPEMLDEISEWSELCEITDCDQFPVGYETYAFGPEVYYFPHHDKLAALKPRGVAARGVRAGRFVDGPDDGTHARSFSQSQGLSISWCCDDLLNYYGLSDEMPWFRDEPPGLYSEIVINLRISPFDDRDHNSVRRPRPLQDLPEDATPEQIEAAGARSYNDDFWALSVEEPNSVGFRAFRLLSKDPMLNGHHIRVYCDGLCRFRTHAFEEDPEETRPHLILMWVKITGDNLFLCSWEEVENGCDPSPDVFDKVPQMLSAIEDMFEAAQVFPDEQE